MILKQDILSSNNAADFLNTWESYTNSWSIDKVDSRRQTLKEILIANFRYTDPRSDTVGHDNLIDIIIEFNNTVPGAYFSTTRFMTHNYRSVATWEMKNADAQTLGSGISYGEYNDSGKLIAISGFYDLPSAI